MERRGAGSVLAVQLRQTRHYRHPPATDRKRYAVPQIRQAPAEKDVGDYYSPMTMIGMGTVRRSQAKEVQVSAVLPHRKEVFKNNASGVRAVE